MSVLFEEPPVAPSNTVTLRNMQLGDSSVLGINTRLAMSMDNTVYTYIDTPNTVRRLMEFVGLTQTEIDNLITFMQATAGKIIKMTDDNAIEFQGHILTEPLEIAELARQVCDRHDVTLEFEGFSEEQLSMLTESIDFIIAEGGDFIIQETLA